MRQVSLRIARSAAVLLLLAVASQAAAAPVEKDRFTFVKYVKRLVLKAFDQLGCPPG